MASRLVRARRALIIEEMSRDGHTDQVIAEALGVCTRTVERTRSVPKRELMPPAPLRHGTRNAYNRGCRCADCTQSGTDYSRMRRAKLREETRTDG